MAVSFIGGGNRSTQRKPLTCRKSQHTLSHNVVSSTSRLVGIRTHNVSVDRHWLYMVNPTTIRSRPRQPLECREHEILMLRLLYDVFFYYHHQLVFFHYFFLRYTQHNLLRVLYFYPTYKYPVKTTDQPQVTGKLFHVDCIKCTSSLKEIKQL
jgi:hypothetical protein